MRAPHAADRPGHIPGKADPAYQEICYNLGRFHQGLGVDNIAAAYYQDALDAPNATPILTRSAALNLANIFRREEATHEHAEDLIYKYLTV